MDVPFFSDCNINPNAQSVRVTLLGFRPVPPAVPQAHRLLSCNSVFLSPMAIPERLKDVPGTVTRVPARSAGTPQEPRILSIAPGRRGPAAQERPPRRSLAYRSQ